MSSSLFSVLLGQQSPHLVNTFILTHGTLLIVFVRKKERYEIVQNHEIPTRLIALSAPFDTTYRLGEVWPEAYLRVQGSDNRNFTFSPRYGLQSLLPLLRADACPLDGESDLRV